ncbi:hypothetical protein C4F40_14350 [Sphingobacterium sp. Ka21]|uniref:Uncharacterized protein n=1 Tax=Sphingobacterium pedocola TaxID=2082722 RepID=A0ABR9T985_9SPHI|nr:hypothetical protein [Sphingobacterium pedocola]
MGFTESAFANTKDGHVLVGLMDTGQAVKGFYLGMRLCFTRIVYLARLNNLGNVQSLKVRFVNAKPFS